MLGYYGGFWSTWVNPQKVTFDGPNKIIIINEGETLVDVQTDLYSNWKEWLAVGDNSKYLPAMRAVGGDHITGDLYLGSTFFLLNGWKIRPWAGDYKLDISGNLYSEDGSDPFVPTLTASSVSVNLRTSNLVDVYVVDNTVPYDSDRPVWDGAVGITSASQSGNFINIAWGSASDENAVSYRVYISDTEANMFTEASYLGEVIGNAMSISTEADKFTTLRDTTYHIGVRAVDRNGNETLNTNTLSVVYMGIVEAAGALTPEQHNKLMSLNNYDDTALFSRLDALGLTTEQHNQLMSLVNYDDKALKNLAYAILGQ